MSFSLCSKPPSRSPLGLRVNLAPGNYTVTVMPYSDKDDVYLSGAKTTLKVSYYVQLSAPQVTVAEVAKEDGVHVVVTIEKVEHAASFVVNVCGKNTTVAAEEGATAFDITKMIEGVGSYDVYVTAKPAKKGNYQESETTLVTYVNEKTAFVEVAFKKVEGGYCAEVSGTDAYYYLVEWTKEGETVSTLVVKADVGGNTVVTAEDVDGVTVTPLAKGYYHTGAPVFATLQ